MDLIFPHILEPKRKLKISIDRDVESWGEIYQTGRISEDAQKERWNLKWMN